MNLILGLIIIGLGIYHIRWIQVNDGLAGTMFKLRGYSIGTLCILLGIALIFDLVQLW